MSSPAWRFASGKGRTIRGGKLQSSVARMAVVSASQAPNIRPVRWWLIAVAVLIAVMVLVGGATRLTESGLSIVEWKPVAGVLPPLNAAQWNEAFEGYKAIPQYRQ